MASFLIHDDVVTVSLSPVEKVEALHGDVSIPRGAITNVREVPNGMQGVHGLRLPGTGIPGVTLVGTFRERGRTTFAVCHGQGPAVVLDLANQPYDCIVVTVDNPAEVVSALR